jgi:hypothetical protein
VCLTYAFNVPATSCGARVGKPKPVGRLSTGPAHLPRIPRDGALERLGYPQERWVHELLPVPQEVRLLWLALGAKQ